MDVSREYEGPITPFQITFPQVLLWGFLMCTATFAISIVKERTNGTFDRCASARWDTLIFLGEKGWRVFSHASL